MKKTTLNIDVTFFNLGDFITAINGISVNQSNVNEVLKKIKGDNQVIFDMFVKPSIFSGRLREATVIDIKLWGFLMLYQIFLSPQVKRSAIISNKHGIYELPH